MTHTPWITAEPDPEAIRRLVEQSFDDRQTVAPDLEALQRSNDATRRSTMAATTPNDLANTHTTLSPNNINDNHAPPTLITQLPIPLPAIQLTMGRAASTSQRSPGEHSTNASASTRVNDHHRPSQATPVPACSLNNQSTDTSAPTGAVIQQTYERTPPAASIPPPSLGEQKVIVSTAANVTKTKDLKEPSPAASQPQQRTEAFANDLSRFSLNSVYQACSLREDADKLLARFDLLCDIHRAHKQEIRAEELERHLHEIRVLHENTVKSWKSTNTIAAAKIYDFIIKFSKQYDLSHHEEVLEKIQAFKGTLGDYADNRIQREWNDMRNKLADMSLRKYTPLGLQGMISVEKGKIRRSVERKLGVGKQRPLDDDTSHKDLQEGQMLYKFIEKQNWKFIDDLKKQLAKQVVYNLCEETWKANESEERKEIEHLLQQAKADLSKQRTDTLRSEVHDISHQVEMLKTVIIVQEELKEAGRRTKALDARCVNIDTADTLEQQVQRQGREVKGLLQRAKRLRHDQLLVTNERKKARLSSLEKSIGELDQTVIQARTTVLAEMFPMRTMKVVDDICQVLDNHGEFIRRLVDPVAADRGEEIGKKHLDNINSTEDGITFPLQFSMERLTKNFVENALSEVSERLDALENKSGS